MLDPKTREEIMKRLGDAIDGVVKDEYDQRWQGPLISQEPNITARICQRVEDRLDQQRVGDYTFRITTQPLPDRGASSLEKKMGADLVMAVSLDGPEGFDKAIFVQSKFDHNIDHTELQDAVGRMKKWAGSKGSYCWIYTENGVRVLSAHQVESLHSNSLADIRSRSTAGFVGRVLDCCAGSKKWGIPANDHRKQVLKSRLREVWGAQGLDILLKRGD